MGHPVKTVLFIVISGCKDEEWSFRNKEYLSNGTCNFVAQLSWDEKTILIVVIYKGELCAYAYTVCVYLSHVYLGIYANHFSLLICIAFYFVCLQGGHNKHERFEKDRRALKDTTAFHQSCEVELYDIVNNRQTSFLPPAGNINRLDEVFVVASLECCLYCL